MIYKFFKPLNEHKFYHWISDAGYLSGIKGFDINFYNSEIASAFNGFIVNKAGEVVGYITEKGEKITSEKDIPDDFLFKIIRQSIAMGYGHGDLGVNNIIKTKDGYSLIDYESSFIDLNSYDALYNYKFGFYRKHILHKYKYFISAYTGVLPPIMLISDFVRGYFKIVAICSPQIIGEDMQFAFYLICDGVVQKKYPYSSSNIFVFSDLKEGRNIKIQGFVRGAKQPNEVYTDIIDII